MFDLLLATMWNQFCLCFVCIPNVNSFYNTCISFLYVVGLKLLLIFLKILAVYLIYCFIFLQIVEKLLIAAVADADVTVRHSIFSALHGNRSFDDFLAQADSLSAVFSALNDEV